MDEEDRTRVASDRDDNFVALPSGFTLGKYEFQAVLGQGGFGITYKAWDASLDRAVAIKEYLPSDVAVRVGGTTVRARSRNDEDSFGWGLERFLDEARALARFEDVRAVVRVYDYMQANGTAYMVMALVDGTPLSAVYRREAPLDEARLKAILLPVLDGLEDVHAAGFLHRDIKPANILIRRDGVPVLIDFGAARQALGERSRSITSVFTPGYAPFEQYTSSGRQGPWTDIYALAATLYHGVTGAAPPQATDRVRQDPMIPAMTAGAGRYGARFLAAIDAGLEVFENRRPQTIGEWRDMLGENAPTAAPGHGVATGAPPTATGHGPASMATAVPTLNESGKPSQAIAVDVSAPQNPAGPRSTAAARQSRRLPLLAAAALAVVVAAGGGYAAWDALETRRIDSERRIAVEAEARAVAEKEAAALQARELARQKADADAKAEAERQARIAEEQARAEADARRKAEAEAAAKAQVEAARLRAEAESRKAAEEEAARKKAEADRRRAEEETARKKAEADQRRAEDEARRQAQARVPVAAPAPAPVSPPPPVSSAEIRALAATQQAAVPATPGFVHAGTWRMVIECPNTPVAPFAAYPLTVSGATFSHRFFRDGEGSGSFSDDRLAYRFAFTGRDNSYLKGSFSLALRGPRRFAGGGVVGGFAVGASDRQCTAVMTRAG